MEEGAVVRNHGLQVTTINNVSYNERALDSEIKRFEIIVHVVDTRKYKKPQLITLFGLTVSDSRSSIVFSVCK